MSTLSIVIPTYNRLSSISRLLERLVEIKAYTLAKIIILDNASDAPYIESLSIYQNNSDKFRYIRNTNNIGLAGNLTKSLEVSNSEWTWILGDDDLPIDNSVHEILETVSNLDPSVCWIKYSCRYGRADKDLYLSDLDDLADYYYDSARFSNLLFISTTIVRTELYKSRIIYSHKYQYSLAPHLAVLFILISEGFSLYVKSSDIVEPSHGTTTWKWHELIPNISTIGEVTNNLKIKYMICHVYKTSLLSNLKFLLDQSNNDRVCDLALIYARMNSRYSVTLFCVLSLISKAFKNKLILRTMNNIYSIYNKHIKRRATN